MNTKRLIEKITPEDIKMIMKTLGSDRCTDKAEEHRHLIFQTICHSGDSHKLYYYIESQKFHCYTHCGQLSIFDLVMNVKKISFYESKLYIMNVLGIDDTFENMESNLMNSSEFNFLDGYEKLNSPLETKEHILKPYSELVMEMFSEIYWIDWIKEGISIPTMKKYNIKFDVNSNAIIIPHYDCKGNLIGIRRRSLNPDEVANGGKYMPMMIEGVWYTHQLQFNLYGLDKNIEAIKRKKRIIIVESEKGAMQLDTMYGENNIAVALSSSNLSNYQRDMILNLGVDEVILSLDKQYQTVGSEEYLNYRKKVINMGKKFMPFVTVRVIWDIGKLLSYKDSPTDKGKEVFETLYATRCTIK